MNQQTLKAPCLIYGKGIHSGKSTACSLLPAPVGTGILFRLNRDGRQVDIPAHSDYVVQTSLNTGVGRDGMVLGTIEHALAALAGMQVDNAIILTHSEEIPIMDGSALAFVEKIEEVGLLEQAAPRKVLKILKSVRVADGDKKAELQPAAKLSFSFELDYPVPDLGQQSLKLEITPESFVKEIAPARTFGFQEDLEYLQKRGQALGAGLDNAVGLNQAGEVLNPEGMRFPDELVRHKILDAIGDLSLVGYPIQGAFVGVKSGHTMNQMLVHALRDQPDHWKIVEQGNQPESKAI